MKKALEPFTCQRGALLIAVIFALILAGAGAALLSNTISGSNEAGRGGITAYQADLLADAGVRYGRHVVLAAMKRGVYSGSVLTGLNNRTFNLAGGKSFALQATASGSQVTVRATGRTADAERGWRRGPTVDTSSAYKWAREHRPPPEIDDDNPGDSWGGATYGGSWGGGDWGDGGHSDGDHNGDNSWDGDGHDH